MDNLDEITQNYRSALFQEDYHYLISYTRKVDILVQIAQTLKVDLNELNTDIMLRCVQIEQNNRIEA